MTASIHFDRTHAWQVGALRLAVILGCAVLLLLGNAGAAQAADSCIVRWRANAYNRMTLQVPLFRP